MSPDWNETLYEYLYTADILVGHNIKYDLLYLWKYEVMQEWLKNGGKIFDTQLAEYVLTGQRHKYPSLRDIAVNKYGCQERPKHMEEYWEDNVKVLDWSTKKIIKTFPKGTESLSFANQFEKRSIDIVRGSIDTSEIPKELVLEDVRNDVLDTEKVMFQQVKLLKEAGQYKLTMELMDSILFTTEMEFQGIYINQEVFQENKNRILVKIEEGKQEIRNIGDKYMRNINFSSPGDISLLMFGGTIKEECQVPIMNELGVQERYKTGQKRGELKTKKGIKLIEVKGLGLKPLKDWETKKKGVYSTDEAVLKKIAIKPNTDAGKIALLMLELRGLEKELGTYYAGQKKGKKTGFEHLIYPDSCIRGSINHCQTDTGRTASNRPNLQNVPSS